MLALVLGFFILFFGIFLMFNKDWDNSVKQHDKDTWDKIMNPSPNGYANSFGAIPLFSWTLARGYEQSSSEEVKALGEKSRNQALVAKYCMLLGVSIIALGFVLAISFGFK